MRQFKKKKYHKTTKPKKQKQKRAKLYYILVQKERKNCALHTPKYVSNLAQLQNFWFFRVSFFLASWRGMCAYLAIIQAFKLISFFKTNCCLVIWAATSYLIVSYVKHNVSLKNIYVYYFMPFLRIKSFIKETFFNSCILVL